MTNSARARATVIFVASALAACGGGDGSGSFRTRRGVEATMHRLTIVVSVLFFANTILAFLAWG